MAGEHDEGGGVMETGIIKMQRLSNTVRVVIEARRDSKYRDPDHEG
jgi:hypothetical protein